jgi:DNA polymerase-1
VETEDSVQAESETKDEQDVQPILLIDAMNLFIRSFAAFPSMSKHGHQIGGCVGFLKTMKKVVGEVFPKRIYVCWEGGGSSRRRGLFKDYKAQRKPEKLNRFYEDDIPETDENRSMQIAALAKLLRHLPVCQIYVSDCEADDVIAHLCKRVFPNEKKVIMSSDKDLFQLLDENTRVYSLHKKTYYTAENIKEEFSIHMKNFALAKAICGDASDNIPGVDGVGFKTLAKRIPLFAAENELLIEDVINYSLAHQKEAKALKAISESEELIRRNWKLVHLGDHALAPIQIDRIDYLVGTFKLQPNKIEFIRRLIVEGIQGFEVDTFYSAFLGVTYG